MNYGILAVCIALLIYDAILAIKGKMTISQKCQEFFPPFIDWCIGIGGLIALCFVKKKWPEFDFTLGVFMAGFWAHVWISNRERYEK